MPPEALTAQLPLEAAAPSSVWRRSIVVLGLSWLALILAFASDWRAMFGQWWNSSTYNHVLLVPPIIGWLIWQRRGAVSQLSPAPWRWGLLALAGAVLLWVLG